MVWLSQQLEVLFSAWQWIGTSFGHASLPLLFAIHVRLKHIGRVTTRIRNGTKSCFLQTRPQGKPVVVSGMGEG